MATKKISALVSEGKILATPDGDEYLYIYEPDGADDANKGLAVKMDTLSSYFSTFVPLTTPLTSTAWDGDEKGVADRAIVDLSAAFGVPAGVKAVLMSIQTTGTAAGDYIRFGPNATYNYAIICRTQVAELINHAGPGPVPCDSNGDIYCYPSTTIPGVNVIIWGYWI